MKKEEFKKVLYEKTKQIGIELTEEQLEKFYLYMNILLEWNEKINLTAITNEEEIILKHFVDSLTINKYIEDSKSLIDVGTGAGFPGIPIKILRQDLKIILLDSLNKRINFLNEVIEKLELKNIECIHGRAEEFGKNKNYREKYDISTSRAVANMSTLSEYLIPFVKIGGKVLAMKGDKAEEELEEAKKAIKLLGGKVENIDNFYLPNSDIKRSIIIIKKIEKTESKFPRKPGMPAKEPIK